MTALIVVFGEVLPKTIAIAYPDRVSLLIAPAVSFFVTVFGPIVSTVEALVRLMLRLCGVNLSLRSSVSGHDELRGAVDILHSEGGVARDERDMFGGLLELSEVTVSDIMVHRTKMRTLDADLPPEELVREALASPYTRTPLWRGEPDNIIGVLHVKDLFRAYAAAGGDVSRINAADIALDAWFVPEATTLRDQLKAFLSRKIHSALVVDEYGVVLGFLTLEDIIEEIVGDIKDEHDVLAQGVRQQLDGSLIVDGSVTIRDLNRAMDWNLPDDEAATIAGLVIHEARAIPEPKQTFSFHGMRFEVLRRQHNRIAALRITPLAPRDGGPVKTEAAGAASPPGPA
jgi:Mg2+/Co2+ transporter CorB